MPLGKFGQAFRTKLTKISDDMEMEPPQPEDNLVHLMNQALDGSVNGDALAREANYSRSYFQRMFRQLTGEAPGDCRRRLLLERAAHQLCRTARPVTDIAFEAHFDSLEGFSRAFRSAHGLSPSHFRRVSPLSWFLPAPNNIHYDPIVGAAVRLPPRQMVSRPQGVTMDLIDRLLEHDHWFVRRLLEKTVTLTDTQLDAPLPNLQQPLPFESVDENLRTILHHLVVGKEAWVIAIQGVHYPNDSIRSPASMLQRVEIAFTEFKSIVRRIRDENLWDTFFVDMSCEPPETFTYGMVVAHAITWAAVRRASALYAMQRIGITDLGYGDPGEWPGELQAIKDAGK